MLQPVLQVLAELNPILLAVELKVLAQRLLMLFEQLADLWLLEERRDLSSQFALTLSLTCLSLCIDTLLQ